jgi:hypothetical protein
MAAPDVFRKKLLSSNLKWKGSTKTIRQICSGIQYNGSAYPKTTVIAPILLRKALPMKGYRREIASVATKCNPRTSMIGQFDSPGQTIITNYPSTKGIVTNVDSHYDANSCQHPLTRNSSTTTCLGSLSTQYNALRRVRSSGIVKRSFNKVTNAPTYYTDRAQYLTSRSRTFKQNQYFHIVQGNAVAKPGTNAAAGNIYRANTIGFCANSTLKYVPIYYKPNNPQFGQQGAVSSSSLVARKRYNTITTAASSFRSAYGKQTADALAYGVNTYGYTLKDRVGFPNIKVPSVAKFNGKLNRCDIVRSMRNLRNG